MMQSEEEMIQMEILNSQMPRSESRKLYATPAQLVISNTLENLHER